MSVATKNYPVKMLDSNQHVKLAEGQTIKGKTFAGKGTMTEIKDRFGLESTYKKTADSWENVGGNGNVIVAGKEKLNCIGTNQVAR